MSVERLVGFLEAAYVLVFGRALNPAEIQRIGENTERGHREGNKSNTRHQHPPVTSVDRVSAGCGRRADRGRADSDATRDLREWSAREASDTDSAAVSNPARCRAARVTHR